VEYLRTSRTTKPRVVFWQNQSKTSQPKNIEKENHNVKLFGKKSNSVRRSGLAAVAVISAFGLVLAGTASAPAADSKSTGKGLVIGWSQRGISGSDWWKTLVDGGQSEATKIGASITVLDANGDTRQQNSDVQTLISKGVDVVIMNPSDPIGVGPAAQALKDAGIPLVVVNSNLDPSLVPNQFCYVAEDQKGTGALAGAEIAKKVVAKFGKSGNFKLLAIGGFPGDIISELRYSGFIKGYESVMKKYPKVKTVKLPLKYGQWKPDVALSPIRDAATANPDVKIVFSMSDVMLGGITQGLKTAGVFNNVLIGSYDGGMAAIKQMIASPKGPLQGIASNQPWDQGATAVKMALAAYNKDAAQCPGKVKFIKTSLITPANAKTYYKPEDTYVRAAG
jgi:ribose transport system substrate-binding protein